MIESITATIPVTGQSYTDLRPTISANSIEEYREQLAEVGRLAGNEQFVHRMTQNKSGKEKINTDQGEIYFDKVSHTYEDAEGNKFLTGSTWSKQFVKEFDPQLVAPKVAEKKLTTVDKVIEGWDCKGETSLLFGTAVHKALECGIKYGEIPNNAYLATLVQDFLDMNPDADMVSEQFVISMEDRMCGTIDCLVNLGGKRVKIIDFKTGDIYKKITLTPEAKELFPNLESKMVSIYQLQLSFYAYILQQRGYTVEGTEIYAEGVEGWQVVKLSILDITKALEAVSSGMKGN